MLTVNYKPAVGMAPIQGTFYPGTDMTKSTIIYIHGGGLIYGSRNDLPHAYLKQFLQAGYPVLSLDYLLAPESPLDMILSSLEAGINYFLDNYQELGVTHSRFILFGRSAGAFLAMQLIRRGFRPQALIDFYGFPDFSANMQRPNSYYLKYPPVNDKTVRSLINERPIPQEDSDERFLLYVYARQTGKWCDLLDAQHFTPFASKDFAQFPATFIQQATQDPDVPFSNSLRLKSKLTQAVLKPVQANIHDFDRIPSPENIQIYQDVLTWLSQIE